MMSQTLTTALLKSHLKFVLTGSLLLLPLLYNTFGISPLFAKGLCFAPFLLYIAVIDWQCGLIFDKLLAVMLAVGICFHFICDSSSLMNLIASGAAFCGLLIVLRLLSRGGMGGGDIKLAFVLGIWLGCPCTIIAGLLSFWIGGAFAALLLLSGTAKKQIAFGPFLALGAMLAFIYGEKLITLYRRFFYV